DRVLGSMTEDGRSKRHTKHGPPFTRRPLLVLGRASRLLFSVVSDAEGIRSALTGAGGTTPETGALTGRCVAGQRSSFRCAPPALGFFGSARTDFCCGRERLLRASPLAYRAVRSFFSIKIRHARAFRRMSCSSRSGAAADVCDTH